MQINEDKLYSNNFISEIKQRQFLWVRACR